MVHVVSVADGQAIRQLDGQSYIAASAAVADGRVYVGNFDNVFICGDIETGETIWQYKSEYESAAFYSSPAVDADVVIIGERNKKLHCIDRQTGEPLWIFQAQSDIDSSPAICGDKVVVGSEDGRVYVISLTDGKEIWVYETGDAVTSSPAVLGGPDGMIIVGCDDGFVYAFEGRQ